MGVISGYLVSAKQRITTRKGVIKTHVTGYAQKLGRDGNYRNDSYKKKKSWNGQADIKKPSWDLKGGKFEYLNNGTTIESEWGENPEKQKSWLQKNSYINANMSLAETTFWENENSVIDKEWGSENNKLTFDALGYETSGTGSIDIGKDGFKATLSGNAEAYLLNAQYEGKYGPGFVNLEASLGAEINGSLSANFNPMDGDLGAKFGGEAFAGGKFEGEAGLEGQYGKLGGNAGVTYGIGVELNADVGFEDWKANVEFDVGATLGLGVDLGVDIEIDAKESAKNVADSGLNAGKKLTGWIPGTPWD